MDDLVFHSQQALIDDFQDLGKEIQLPPLFLYQGQYIIECILAHVPQKYDAYWHHPDHLGSSNYITNFNGNISQHTCPERSRRMVYLPFGETLVEEHLNSYNSPYRFNAKELDAETGWYYYGARYYNPKWSVWLSVDPLADKYPNWSPYAYTFNNPINFIDPDGKEGIVVSGSPGNHKNREHFLMNGLYKAKAAQKHFQRKGETVTWIVYNDKENGYTQKQIDTYREKAAKVGVTLKVVSSVDDIVDYVNNKNGGDSRKNDKITSFYYVGHSTPGDLDVGYQGTGEDFEPDDFDNSAFSSGTHVNLIGGCRTDVPALFEDSNVTQFQEILDKDSNIYGTDVRVYYPGGVVSDEKLVEKNNGEILHRKGELPTK